MPRKKSARVPAFAGFCDYCENEPDEILAEHVLDDEGYHSGLRFTAQCHGMRDQLILEYAPYTGKTVMIHFFSGVRSGLGGH